MSDRQFDYVRQKMIKPYEIKINTRGREYLNRKLMPHFASFFKDGDKVLFVGRHPLWDYSPFFNSPARQCEYIVSDIDDGYQPTADVIDNIGESKFATDNFDGVILVGVFDSLKNTTGDKVTSEVSRILKPDGRILIAWGPMPEGSYNPVTAWPAFIIDEAHWVWGSWMMEEGSIYGKGDHQAVFIIGRNKK